MAESLKILAGKLRVAATKIPLLFRALSLVWAAAPGHASAWAVLLVIQGLLPVATVYLTRMLVDGMVALLGAGGGWDNFRPMLVLVVLMAGIMLLTVILRSVTGWIRIAQAELVSDSNGGAAGKRERPAAAAEGL